MKKWVVLLLVFLMVMTVVPAEAKQLPGFVAEFVKGFRYNLGWSRMFAWGTGVYTPDGIREKEFLWLAWSNSDGLLSFLLDRAIDDADLVEISKIRDKAGCRWEPMVMMRLFAKDQTCISTSNDWIEGCKLVNANGEKRWLCDDKKTIDSATEILRKLPFFRKLKVEQYL